MKERFTLKTAAIILPVLALAGCASEARQPDVDMTAVESQVRAAQAAADRAAAAAERAEAAANRAAEASTRSDRAFRQGLRK